MGKKTKENNEQKKKKLYIKVYRNIFGSCRNSYNNFLRNSC